jgi:cation diffusion facilitator family transporter
MSGSPDSLKSILFALVANFSIAVAKGFAAAFTGSSAMLAEAIHSLADSGNQLLLILGLKQSKRPPSAEYPLGYGKSIYFWSFLVALVLFSLGGLFSIYEGWHKLSHPQDITAPLIAIGVLIFAIFAEGISLWGCMREVNKERHGRKILHWFRESRTSELVVVFGEDVAALLGLVTALLAIAATMITGNPLYDAIGTLVIGGLLLVIAFFIAIEVKALLIGQSVEPRILEQMHHANGSRRDDRRQGKDDAHRQRAGNGRRDQPGRGRFQTRLPRNRLAVFRAGCQGRGLMWNEYQAHSGRRHD